MNSACISSQRGNALWFILIGVALLAALTIILSRSGSNVSQTGDFEQRSIQSSEILRYAESLRAAIQQMKLQGVSENNISFQNGVTATDYTNTNCDDASDRNFPDCLLFDARGAGLTYKAPRESWLDSSKSAQDFYGEWLFTGGSCVSGVGRDPVNSCTGVPQNAELLVILPFVKKSLCQQINRSVNFPTTTGNPPVDSVQAWESTADAPFVGQYTADREITDSGYVDIPGNPIGCFEGDTLPPSGTYHVYFSLLER